MSKNLGDFIAKLEAAASRHESEAAFWSTCGLCLQIWAGAKRGFVPAPEWDPRVNRNLMPLYRAAEKFGAALVAEVDARAFAEVA